MRVVRFIAGMAIGISVCAGTTFAQSGLTPAEYPPESFKGRQFVDSAGCVFLRAGIDGNVSWAPRVNSQRQPICGQTPTVFEGTSTTSVAPAPEVPVVEVEPDNPDVDTALDLETPSSDTQITIVIDAPIATQNVPEPETPVFADGSAFPQPIIAVEENPQQAVISDLRPRQKPKARAKPVRRQAAKPVNRKPVNRMKPATTKPVERVVPKHVALAREDRRKVTVPRGFEPIWKDDRLNPKRAEQTRAGHRKMKLIWTSTVPRRLINQTTGEDMTQKLALVYPYTDQKTQRRELGKVSIATRDGKVVKRIKRRVTKTKIAPIPQSKQAQPAVARFVQVGAFANPDNAARAARRLQSKGLGARLVKSNHGGRVLQLVWAGPFANDQDAARAVVASRQVGFRDAFVVK